MGAAEVAVHIRREAAVLRNRKLLANRLPLCPPACRCCDHFVFLEERENKYKRAECSSQGHQGQVALPTHLGDVAFSRCPRLTPDQGKPEAIGMAQAQGDTDEPKSRLSLPCASPPCSTPSLTRGRYFPADNRRTSGIAHSTTCGRAKCSGGKTKSASRAELLSLNP